MATSLLKLSMTATKPTTETKPTVTNFFNIAPQGGYTGSQTYTINDVNWIDDTGTAVTAGGLETIVTNNGYALLFINGTLQESSVLTSITATSIIITFGGLTEIEEGKIITVSIVNFNPDTSAPIITG